MSFPERLQTTPAHHLARGTWPVELVAHVGLVVPPTVEANDEVRRGARALLDDVVTRDERDIALLLLSELVTNAVRYQAVADPVRVDIAVARRQIRVEVRDGGDGFEVAAHPGEGEARAGQGGFGLLIVDRASSRWGIAQDRPHCVWFELDREPLD